MLPKRLSATFRYGIPTLLALSLVGGIFADEADESLRFDREIINRYSLDHLPRSLSIRQGEKVWIGYDLERGKVYKVWLTPENRPGLKGSGFVVRSDGDTLFEDKTELTWTLRRGKEILPLKIRYLGCSDREGRFELRWELRHEGGVIHLSERIESSPGDAGESMVRELRIEVPDGDAPVLEALALIPPASAVDAWRITTATKPGKAPALEKSGISGPEWHRLTLR